MYDFVLYFDYKKGVVTSHNVSFSHKYAILGGIHYMRCLCSWLGIIFLSHQCVYMPSQGIDLLLCVAVIMCVSLNRGLEEQLIRQCTINYPQP